MKVIKRDGRAVDFDRQKIINAVHKVFIAVDGALTPYAEEKAINIAEYVEKHFPDSKERFITCDFDPIELSSTQIRDAIRDGESVEGLLDAEVLKYIKEKELYL